MSSDEVVLRKKRRSSILKVQSAQNNGILMEGNTEHTFIKAARRVNWAEKPHIKLFETENSAMLSTENIETASDDQIMSMSICSTVVDENGGSDALMHTISPNMSTEIDEEDATLDLEAFLPKRTENDALENILNKSALEPATLNVSLEDKSVNLNAYFKSFCSNSRSNISSTEIDKFHSIDQIENQRAPSDMVLEDSEMILEENGKSDKITNLDNSKLNGIENSFMSQNDLKLRLDQDDKDLIEKKVHSWDKVENFYNLIDCRSKKFHVEKICSQKGWIKRMNKSQEETEVKPLLQPALGVDDLERPESKSGLTVPKSSLKTYIEPLEQFSFASEAKQFEEKDKAISKSVENVQHEDMTREASNEPASSIPMQIENGSSILKNGMFSLKKDDSWDEVAEKKPRKSKKADDLFSELIREALEELNIKNKALEEQIQQMNIEKDSSNLGQALKSIDWISLPSLTTVGRNWTKISQCESVIRLKRWLFILQLDFSAVPENMVVKTVSEVALDLVEMANRFDDYFMKNVVEPFFEQIMQQEQFSSASLMQKFQSDSDINQGIVYLEGIIDRTRYIFIELFSLNATHTDVCLRNNHLTVGFYKKSLKERFVDLKIDLWAYPKSINVSKVENLSLPDVIDHFEAVLNANEEHFLPKFFECFFAAVK